MKKNTYIIIFILSAITPVISFAAFTSIKGLITSFQTIIKLSIPVVFGLALLYFFWGMANFILHAGDEKTLEEGKQKMIWGVVALTVIVSIYGILNLIGDSVGIKPGTCPNGVGSPSDISPCTGD